MNTSSSKIPRLPRLVAHWLLVAPLLLADASPLFAAATDARQKVDWKLFFNQVWALEIRKEMRAKNASDAAIREAIREHTGYTPLSFSATLKKVQEVTTSAEASKLREKVFSDEASYDKIMRLDFSASVPSEYQSLPEVKRLLQGIVANQNRVPSRTENFFSSPEGETLTRAITVAASGSQDVAFVLVPGYAAHAIKFGIFPEIVGEANRFHQRPEERPLLEEGAAGIDLKYENYAEFYSRGTSGESPFDILSPAGVEMGNTVGFNAETADLLASWIAGLPPKYRQRKLILLGYSKGAPIVFELLQRHPELKSQVLGMVTYGGVVQGTHVARMGKETIDGLLGVRTIGELIDRVRPKGTDESLRALLPFLSPFDLSFTQLDSLQRVLAVYGIDMGDMRAKVDRLLEGREVRELLDGIVDLAPYTRTLWNLRHLDSSMVQPDTFLMNLSAVSDIAAFASNRVTKTQTRRAHSILAPVLTPQNKLDWPGLSLDAWFLYLSSLEGFKMAPGGLYDTQVDLQHTKSPWLDESPLSMSLTDAELAQLWAEQDVQQKLAANGITSLSALKSTPRNKLFKPKTIENLRSIDLGEFKGHHWSLFHQAFRPAKEQSETFAIWEFPRGPFIKAVMYTMALHTAGNRAN
jgi:pimeloyl-ACP methyl ester carboxylesterase